MKPWKLADNNYGHVKNQNYEVAVLPLGALPNLTTFTFHMEQIYSKLPSLGIKSAKRLTMLAPRSSYYLPFPFGTETNLREFPLAINLNPSTLHMVIRDIVDSLLNDGIKKIVLLNSHGGNGFKPLLRELSGKNEAHVFLCNWYQALEDVYFDIFEKAEDHAGEMETSFGLAFFPELVAKNPDGTLNADDGSNRDQQNSTR